MSRWEGVHDVSLQAKPLAIATLKKTETRTNIPTITAADRIGFAENGSKKKIYRSTAPNLPLEVNARAIAKV